jgi:hypothetical protein
MSLKFDRLAQQPDLPHSGRAHEDHLAGLSPVQLTSICHGSREARRWSRWIVEQVFDRLEPVVRRHWWWNGRFGRLARRDVVVHEHDGRWVVEARRGGVEGSSRWAEVASEAAAVELARSIQDEPTAWSELPVTAERDRDRP